MNDDTGGGRGRLRRGGVLAAAVAGIILPLAACGGGGPSHTAGSTTYQKAVAYARCMRSHGEPGWPGPTSKGTFVPTGIDLGSAQAKSAHFACSYLLPDSADPLTAAHLQQTLSQNLKYSECMRAHGITNYPDPKVQGQGVAVSLQGLDPQSPQFQAADRTCEAVRNGSGGGS
jgi:hypothetical protein